MEVTPGIVGVSMGGPGIGMGGGGVTQTVRRAGREATAAAVGVGAAVKALAAKGLVSSMGGTPGGGHGLGSLLDKLHHLRHGRRLRRGGRGGVDTELIRKRKTRGAGTPRERSGMHEDILRELDAKYRPRYEDPLDKFDDAA